MTPKITFLKILKIFFFWGSEEIYCEVQRSLGESEGVFSLKCVFSQPVFTHFSQIKILFFLESKSGSHKLCPRQGQSRPKLWHRLGQVSIPLPCPSLHQLTLDHVPLSYLWCPASVCPFCLFIPLPEQGLDKCLYTKHNRILIISNISVYHVPGLLTYTLNMYFMICTFRTLCHFNYLTFWVVFLSFPFYRGGN